MKLEQTINGYSGHRYKENEQHQITKINECLIAKGFEKGVKVRTS